MKTKFIVTLLSILLSTIAYADLPFKKITWPNDDRPHLFNPSVITEWWTYTGKITAKNGDDKRQFFYYVNLRYTRDTAGDVPTLTVLVTDINNGIVYDNNGVPLKGVRMSADTLDIASPNFSLKSKKDKYELHLTTPVQKTLLTLDLQLTPLKKPILMGTGKRRGLLNMGGNTNAFDYTISNLRTSGFIQIGEEKFDIDPDPSSSSSWMDHQWGDFSLAQSLKTHASVWVGARLANGTDVSVKEFIKPISDATTNKTAAGISLKTSDDQYKSGAIIVGPAGDGGYPAYYTLVVGKRRYRLEPVVNELNRNNTWVGILKVNGKDVKQPGAPFAIVEDMAGKL